MAVNSSFGAFLKSRIFSLSDQEMFARFSGDSNPVHVNPSEARRTIAGQCIVHGINALLWALDTLVAEKRIQVNAFEAKFLNSIFLDEPVDCFWNSEVKKLYLVSGAALLCTVRVVEGDAEKADELQIPCVLPDAEPTLISFTDAVAMQEKDLSFRGNRALAQELYPAFCEYYGSATACEIAMVSEIVGMRVPGRNSLFLSFAAEFRRDNGKSTFSVVKHDSRFETVSLAINAITFKGIAKTVFRPAMGLSRSMEELSRFVKKDEFSHVKALIVGGSRGLGEIAAKLIACGGGQVIITYHSGAADARNVNDAIRAFGGQCSSLQFTVGTEKQEIADLTGINQLYYFATPKIFGKRSAEYDQELMQAFSAVYVDGFEKICEQLLRNVSFLSVLYPSTVAIDNPLPGLTEYIEAKLRGEELCAELNKRDTIYVTCPRLPRIDTDQTLSLIKVPSADSAEVLLPLIRQMSAKNHHRV